MRSPKKKRKSLNWFEKNVLGLAPRPTARRPASAKRVARVTTKKAVGSGSAKRRPVAKLSTRQIYAIRKKYKKKRK